MAFVWLAISACFPLALTVIFLLLDRFTKFGNAKYITRQIVIGLAFGAIAIIQIQFSTRIGLDALSAADAVPLCAALIFGGPAGIISGVIGGVFRWLAAFWGIGVFTRWGCAIAIVLAGFYGTFVRRFFFENRQPNPVLAFCIGVVMESVHYFLYFLTNVSAYETVMTIIKNVALAGALATSFCLFFATLIANAFNRKSMERENGSKKRLPTIQNKIQIKLLIAFLATLICTICFTFLVQCNLSIESAESLLSLNVQDIKKEIKDQSDKNLLQSCEKAATDFQNDMGIYEIKNKYDVSDVNYINSDGIIQESTNEDFLGYDMGNGEQSAEFLEILGTEDSMVQAYGPISYDNSTMRKYAGKGIAGGGILQIGYDAKEFQDDINDKVTSVANNRHVGSTGYMIITSGTTVLSAPSDFAGVDDGDLDKIVSGEIESNTIKRMSISGEECLTMYDSAEGYYIIAVLPFTEAFSGLEQSVLLMGIILIIIFAILYGIVYMAIKHSVLKNLGKVSESLTSIAGGNLEVTVDVHDNREFDILSKDINTTVDTLKGYTEEIKANYEKDMNVAKDIQSSVLPRELPYAENHKELELFSYMNTAKEVGGDFFDYYWLNGTELLVMVADVSGKGVPAAMFMMRAKTLIRETQEKGATLDEALTNINNQLCEGNDAGMFVTAWIAVINVTNGHVRYVNAGHNPPVLRLAGEEFKYLKGKAGFVLAGLENYKYKIQEMDITPGTILYLYTDGVTEATNADNKLFGEERLVNCLNANADKDMKEICGTVMDDIDRFVGDAPQFDDITMVAVKFKYCKNEDINN